MTLVQQIHQNYERWKKTVIKCFKTHVILIVL